LIFCDDDAGEDLALVENFKALFIEPLFEGELVFVSFGSGDGLGYFSC